MFKYNDLSVGNRMCTKNTCNAVPYTIYGLRDK